MIFKPITIRNLKTDAIDLWRQHTIPNINPNIPKKRIIVYKKELKPKEQKKMTLTKVKKKNDEVYEEITYLQMPPRKKFPIKIKIKNSKKSRLNLILSDNND